MQQRIDRLHAFLIECSQQSEVQLEPENWEIYVEGFELTASFPVDESLELLADIVFPATAYLQDGTHKAFQMFNDYEMTLAIRNYGGDIDMLGRLLMHWLHKERLIAKVSCDLRKNNQSTYDLWFDFNVSESTHSTGDEVMMC